MKGCSECIFPEYDDGFSNLGTRPPQPSTIDFDLQTTFPSLSSTQSSFEMTIPQNNVTNPLWDTATNHTAEFPINSDAPTTTTDTGASTTESSTVETTPEFWATDSDVSTLTTTPNWKEVCKDLCKIGEGGVLCNCDLPPLKMS